MPEPINDQHPAERQLADFLNGKLDPSEHSNVEAHVLTCNQCVGRLERIHDDTMHERLRAMATHFEVPSETERLAEERVPAELVDHPRYEIQERIGEGGMGNVYRARHRSMDRDVAIKVLRPHLFENDRAIARFQNEIRVAAKLNHPTIVHSYDAETTQGLHLLVMELVKGQRLSDLVDQKPLDPERACEIGLHIADGLEHAKSKGTIHRDIKPQNILVSADGVIKITDFGLAKFVLDSAQPRSDGLTLAGEMFGTPDYMAPEQIRDSSAADFRSDIYSLGCTVYFMLAGHAPFSGLSQSETLAAQLERMPTPLISIRPEIPQEMSDLVQRMMAKNPDRRFASYQQLIDELAPFGRTSRTMQVDVGASFPLNVSDGRTKIEEAETTSVGDRRQMQQSKLNRRAWLGSAARWGAISAATIGAAYSFWPKATVPLTNFRLAVVFPFAKAYHPEANEVFRWAEEKSGVTIEYLAERVGNIRFGYRGSGRVEPLEAIVRQTVEQAEASEFDSILFCGGWDGNTTRATTFAFDPKLMDQAHTLVRQFLALGKPVGSVCGGTAVLVNAGLLDGKRAAFCPYLAPVIPESKMEKVQWSAAVDTPQEMVVVQDGLIVTGGTSRNIPEMLDILYQQANQTG